MKVIKSILVLSLLVFGVSSPGFAKQDGGGGKGAMKENAPMMKDRDHSRDMKMDREMREEHQRKMDKGMEDHDPIRYREKEMKQDREMKEEREMKKDMEKQREMKSEQERKELGQGSEQGQEMREEHSRKWWRFWE